MKEGYDMEQLDQMRVQQEILEKQVTVLETMIETHKLARFDENLGNLKTSMRKHLKLISSEFLVMEYDPENQRKIGSSPVSVGENLVSTVSQAA